MRIYKIKPDHKYENLTGAVIALGSFDGLHRGHQKIITSAIKFARSIQHQAGIITYQPIPQVLLYPDFHFLLTTDQEKKDLLRKLNIDFIGFVNFTKKLQQLEAEQFITDYIVKTINPLMIVVGVDHHFGKEHKGNVILLKKLGKKYNFKVKVISNLKYYGASIKSTRIRELLILGNIKRANELLGHPYSLTGKVIKGKGLAKTLGFPTLNLSVLDKRKLIPADGVYQVYAKFQGKQYNGVMNIGFAPTIADKLNQYSQRSIEVHLFDFLQTKEYSLNKIITVQLINRLRAEKKFDNLEELKKQIALDIECAKKLFYEFNKY